MPSSKLSIQFIIAFFLFAACDPERIIDVNQDLDGMYWHADSVKEFSFIIQETGDFNLYINLRNTESYPFHNVFITYFLQDSTGNEIESELIDYNLFNSKTGFPYGKSGIGDLFDHQFRIKENIRLNGYSKYYLNLQHYMRVDSLPEIVSVGIRVEKSNN